MLKQPGERQLKAAEDAAAIERPARWNCLELCRRRIGRSRALVEVNDPHELHAGGKIILELAGQLARQAAIRNLRDELRNNARCRLTRSRIARKAVGGAKGYGWYPDQVITQPIKPVGARDNA